MYISPHKGGLSFIAVWCGKDQAIKGPGDRGTRRKDQAAEGPGDQESASQDQAIKESGSHWTRRSWIRQSKGQAIKENEETAAATK